MVRWFLFRVHCCFKPHFGKAERMQIERSDEGIQETHGIFSRDLIVERFREDQGLGAIQTSTMIHCLKETLETRKKFHMTKEFSHRLALEPTAAPLLGLTRLSFRTAGSSGCGSALIR